VTTAADLNAARAALTMINPAPYNAEAPALALTGDLTPAALHYVRSNFAVPEHDGSLQIGGAIDKPVTLTLDDLRGMPAHEQGGDPGVRGQRPSRHEAAAHRGAVGRLRGLHARWTGCSCTS
jgi:hypothetical protein